MNITQYLDLYDSYLNTSLENNPTDFTKEVLKQALIDAVNRLKNYRLDDYATYKTLMSILEAYKKPIKTPDCEIHHYEETTKSKVFSDLLLKYFKREKSYYYGYLLLQQEENCRRAFSVDIHFMSEQEVEEAVLDSSCSDKPSHRNKDRQFADLLLCEKKGQLLPLLHSLLDCTTSKKDFAIAIIALEELGLLGKYGTKKELYQTLQFEFGNIGTQANFNLYLNPNNRKKILNSEIESFTIPISRLVEKTT